MTTKQIQAKRLAEQALKHARQRLGEAPAHGIPSIDDIMDVICAGPDPRENLPDIDQSIIDFVNQNVTMAWCSESDAGEFGKASLSGHLYSVEMSGHGGSMDFIITSKVPLNVTAGLSQRTAGDDKYTARPVTPKEAQDMVARFGEYAAGYDDVGDANLRAATSPGGHNDN